MRKLNAITINNKMIRFADIFRFTATLIGIALLILSVHHLLETRFFTSFSHTGMVGFLYEVSGNSLLAVTASSVLTQSAIVFLSYLLVGKFAKGLKITKWIFVSAALLFLMLAQIYFAFTAVTAWSDFFRGVLFAALDAALSLLIILGLFKVIQAESR